MLIGLTIAVIYTSFSGMRGMSAVGRIVCFGIYILLIAFVLMTLPKFGGFTVMLSELPAEYSSMGNMPTQRIIAWILGGCLSTAVMQSVLQPLLAAKSASAARTGSILGYVLAAPICLLTATCGIFAKRPVRTWATVPPHLLLHQDLQQSGFRWDHFCLCHHDHRGYHGHHDAGHRHHHYQCL